MIFSTPVFLFLFLPVFLCCYYTSPVKYRTHIILLGSWIFYGFWRIDFLGLVIITTICNYFFGRSIYQNRLKLQMKKRVLSLSIGLNLLILAYFKYYNFGIDSLNVILAALGRMNISTIKVILPVGISFYIFQSMSYVIDVYREDAEPAENFITLAAYISLFPQLIAGPILRYKDVARQFKVRTHSLRTFGEGFFIFTLGLGRKVLIADTVAILADSSFSLGSPSFLDTVLGTAAYAVQLYFDFSGYSDMAVGLGLMLGFRFMRNFNAPYLSRSITEFWQRWHISLSTWLRDYLYIPLGGNRTGALRTYVNLSIVMLLGGLWHGAAWQFVLWGAWHGFWLVIERTGIGPKVRIPNFIRWFTTICIVLIGWIFFRSTNLHRTFIMFNGLFLQNGFGISPSYNWQISRFALSVLAVSGLVLLLEKYNSTGRIRQGMSKFRGFAAGALFIVSVIKLLADSYSPFLYFRF